MARNNFILGEMSILGEQGGKVSASVVADSKVFLYAIERSFISKIFESEPGLYMRYYFVVAQKLAKLLVSLAPPDKSKAEAETSEVAVATASAEQTEEEKVFIDCKQETNNM